MPVIRLADVPEVAQIGPGLDTIVMKKVIGAKERDPSFEMPDETPSLSITHVKIWGSLGRSYNDETDRAMFIVDGDGVASVGDHRPQVFGPGDFILIPRGSRVRVQRELHLPGDQQPRLPSGYRRERPCLRRACRSHRPPPAEAVRP